MSDAEQKKYCINKSIKNIVVGSLISIPTLFVGGAVYNSYITMKGDNTILGPKLYIKSLNNIIAAYRNDINRLNKRLKEL